ncbi:uncharacterized protein EI90DRAFT_2414696 [Cantharellus anzutake]|uniref:uncharacterized protein n=1 Tax=Cantharellus anzutake TaxID=1750568 RepID=UPI0019082A12|nr:uncharacterized protein EI90DRAFT_2414696 [Cantharellus anzutake]KAF8338787.1 hypothetical protein EI90DRAFT_2414696 [Cantharellus anzutake]
MVIYCPQIHIKSCWTVQRSASVLPNAPSSIPNAPHCRLLGLLAEAIGIQTLFFFCGYTSSLFGCVIRCQQPSHPLHSNTTGHNRMLPAGERGAGACSTTDSEPQVPPPGFHYPPWLALCGSHEHVLEPDWALKTVVEAPIEVLFPNMPVGMINAYRWEYFHAKVCLICQEIRRRFREHEKRKRQQLITE